ncbi:MAG TPA: hypothetical protein VIJ82_26330, partial [Streptosporangiaceae bacterium]
MPAHDRVRANQQPQSLAARFGYHGEQSREQSTVCPVQPQATWAPPLQDGELMAKDQDLHGLLRTLTLGQPQPRCDPCDQEEHNRRHMIGDHLDRTAQRATPLVTAVDDLLGTHNMRNRDGLVRGTDLAPLAP